MNPRDIQSVLAQMKNRVVASTNEIKAFSFNEKFGGLATKIFNYSKRVLELEGITETPTDTSKATDTDLMLAKALAKDVVGDGWDGSGQGVMKMFSLFLGRNLNAKEVGLKCSLRLPKFTVVKRDNGTLGMISENSNLMIIKGKSFTKDTSFYKTNQEMNVASNEETTIFIGTILSDDALLRSFSSTMKVSTLEEVDQAIEVSINGLNMTAYDQYEYKSFMADLNKDLTQGVAV